MSVAAEGPGEPQGRPVHRRRAQRCGARRWPASKRCARRRRRPDFRRRARAEPGPDPPVDARRRQRVLHVPAAGGDVSEAIRRTAARRDGRRPRADGDDAGVLRRERRGRHDDGRRELRRRARAPVQQAATMIVDLKPGLGEVGLFLGVRSRYTPRRRARQHEPARPEFLRELVAKHKSGLEILAGSDNFDRPERGGRRGHRRDPSAAARGIRVRGDRRRAARSTPASWRRSTRPTPSVWSRIRTCRRFATPSGCSIASARWARRRIASGCC